MILKDKTMPQEMTVPGKNYVYEDVAKQIIEEIRIELNESLGSIWMKKVGYAKNLINKTIDSHLTSKENNK